MRQKLALTIALAVLMAVVAGANLAAAESQQVKPAGTDTGSGQPTTPAAPPVVAPGTPIGGGVQAAPPLQGTITAPESGGAAPQIGNNSEETAPTSSGGTTSAGGAAGTPPEARLPRSARPPSGSPTS